MANSPTPSIPTHVRKYLDKLSQDKSQLATFTSWYNHEYSNGNNPTSKPPLTTPSRALSPYPTHNPPISILNELAASPERYSITKEDLDEKRAAMVAISSLPKYLVFCANRVKGFLQIKHDTTVGWHNVFRCAIHSGLNQLTTDARVKKLIEFKSATYTMSPGAILSNEINALHTNMKFTAPAPGGYEFQPKRLNVTNEMNARLNAFMEDLGMNKSLLMVTAICFGFYNQPEVIQDPNDPHDHSYTIADHVSMFDALVEIRLAMSQVLNKLSQGMEDRKLTTAQRRKSSRRKSTSSSSSSSVN